jgi:hypothetical protein
MTIQSSIMIVNQIAPRGGGGECNMPKLPPLNFKLEPN